MATRCIRQWNRRRLVSVKVCMRRTLPFLSVLLVVTACANSSDSAVAPHSPVPESAAIAPSASPAVSPVATPSGVVTIKPPANSGPTPGASAASKGEITVTGTVADGVERGCRILRTDTVVYQLMGGDRAVLTEGSRVTVRGRPDPGLLTTCQQGTPLHVVDARPA